MLRENGEQLVDPVVTCVAGPDGLKTLSRKVRRHFRIAEYVAQAREGTGADNVIAAILVDFRALDTLGEISVLMVAAAGTASLVLATRFDRRDRRGGVESGSGTPDHEKEVLG